MFQLRLGLTVFLGALVAPALANAATIIGPANPNPNPGGAVAASWGSGVMLVNTAGPAGALFAAPSEGVITSWRLYTDDVGPEATAQLYALTPLAGHEFRMEASGPKEAVPAITPTGVEDQNVFHEFPAGLAVKAGTMLGARFEYGASSTLKPVYYLGAGNSLERIGTVPAIGGTATSVTYGGNMLAMNATLEPDIDHDGLGDETQDPCVGVCQPPPPASTPASAPPANPVVKEKPKKCKKNQKRKRGKCVKKKHQKKRHPRK